MIKQSHINSEQFTQKIPTLLINKNYYEILQLFIIYVYLIAYYLLLQCDMQIYYADGNQSKIYIYNNICKFIIITTSKQHFSHHYFIAIDLICSL